MSKLKTKHTVNGERVEVKAFREVEVHQLDGGRGVSEELVARVTIPDNTEIALALARELEEYVGEQGSRLEPEGP